MVYIPIAEYRPDVASVNSAYTDVMVNVLPSEKSYMPVPSLITFSQGLEEQVLGAFAFRSENAFKIVAGTATKLYVYDGTTHKWSDASRDGEPYSADVNNRWSFTVFSNRLLAVNRNDKPQSLMLPAAPKFADLEGNPPQAGLVRVWGDFVCLMRLKAHPSRVHWSGLNKPTQWTPGEDSCDYQDFPDGEYVQGSTEATNPIIFMRTAIYSGSFFPGSKLIFTFQKIQDKRGAKSAESIACRGEYGFFIDDGGFYQIGANGGILPIGFERVDRTLFREFDNIDIGDLQGVVDPFHNRVYWALRRSNNEQTTFVYDWGLQKWSTFNTPRLLLFPAFTLGYTLEKLDEVSADIEKLYASLDNRIWQTGAPALAAVDDRGRFGLFLGEPMEATVISQEVGESNGQLSFCSKIFAEVDTIDGLLSVGERLIRADWCDVLWGKERYASQHTGAYHCRSRSRYHRFKLRIPAGTNWHHLSGFNVELTPAGFR